MKVIYPVCLSVKKGGKDTIWKLYLNSKFDHWLANKESEKVFIHFGKESFSNPTKGEWNTYHSFNNSKTISLYLQQHFSLDDKLTFYAIEDKEGYLHFIYVE